MAKRDYRFFLLNALLFIIVISGIYYFTLVAWQFNVRYLIVLVILLYTGTSLNRAKSVVSPPRFPILQKDNENMGLPELEDVNFNSKDGIELNGWYVPSKNRAAVIMVHSWRGSRIQMRNYARALASEGFGVLLFDLRSHARSGGEMSSFGWTEHLDLIGAYDFIKMKDEIDPHRVGVLGFSMGAQIAVRAEVATRLFGAVWVDGLIPIVYSDHFAVQKRNLRQFFFSPWWWLAYEVQSWLTRVPQPAELTEVISKMSPTPLQIVSAGSGRMIKLSDAFAAAAGETCDYWRLEDIPFGSGILEYGDDYDFKLVGFFSRYLLRDPK